ncbi:hypothetical protein T06_9441 [Trichinella sp. T6]|nr:hypothetical protein T06_9441 [Trichinella sp. T6]
MADITELRFVPNRGGRLNYFGIGQRRLQGCHMDKPGCDICDHAKGSHRKLPKETKPILAIYDEEVSAASAVPSVSGNFLLFKRMKSTMYSHRASSHILVLATGSNIRLMATRRTWALDGTFKIVSQWYQQLFTIHAFLAGKLVLAVYCLCTDKDIPTYGFILSKSGITGNPQRQS